MSKPKRQSFNGPSQIAHLMGMQSQALAENSRNSIKKIPRDKLVFLECNEEVYDEIMQDERLEPTALDISQRGIQQPLLVFPQKNGTFCVISGNRRLAGNDLAVEKYGYTEGDYIPCIEIEAPDNPQDLRMAMIKDNLQRDKTSHERMREIVVYYQQLVEKHQDQGRQKLREKLYADLGVSASEVTRYFKINESLLPEIKQHFKKGLLSTDVAFELAKEPEETQRYIHEHWPEEDGSPVRLSKPHMLEMLAEISLNAVRDQINTGSPGRGSQKKDKPVIVFKDVADGVWQLGEACTSMHEVITTASDKDIDKKTEKKLLSKLAKEMSKLSALREEILALYGAAPDDEA